MANSEITQNKKIQTCLNNLGVEFPAQSSTVKNKRSQTCIEAHGHPHPMQSDTIKKKIQETNKKRFGCISPLGNTDIRKKSKLTCQRKYNVEHNFCEGDLRDKIKQTFVKKYGCENPMQNTEVHKKAVQTLVKHHGVDNPMKSDTIRKKAQATCLTNHGVTNPMHSSVIKSKCSFTKQQAVVHEMFFGNRLGKTIVPLFTEKEFTSGKDKRYKFVCNTCNTEFTSYIQNGNIPRCYTCHPILRGTSNIEKELFEFIKQLDDCAVQGTKSIIPPLELDIFSEKFKLAFEINGLYWHSEIGGNKTNTYHVHKTNECNKRNIQLVHIFEDEWVHKRLIIQNKIKSLFGSQQKSIGARQTNIHPISAAVAKRFLNDNHIQGYSSSRHYLGMFFDSDLISVLSFGQSRFQAGELEIIRYCSTVPITGGFQKFLKYIQTKFRISRIVTFADKRFSGTNNVYTRSNFKLISETTPSYFYTDYSQRFYRMQFQKHKLSRKLAIYKDTLSTWQNMQLNGYDRIWDCGNYKYEYSFQ